MSRRADAVSLEALRARTCVLLAALALLRTGGALAAGFEPDMTAIIQETQKVSTEPDELSIVWWIPTEYWGVAMAQDPTVTRAQIEQFLTLVRPYTLVAVVKAEMGMFGVKEYESEEELRAHVWILDGKGKRYAPLADEDVKADTKTFLAMMKPVLSNMIGPMGGNFHFLVFPAEDTDGRSITDVRKEGRFTVVLAGTEHRWRLPLGSLLPPKYCEKCEEDMNGAYKFCPYCGTRLPKAAKRKAEPVVPLTPPPEPAW
jgi:hypothetical protein